MESSARSERDLGGELQDQEFNRQRTDPHPGDPSYLPLTDLLAALKSLTQGLSGHLLDYGCGGSPYRSLFTECMYHRADFTALPGLDFLVGEAGEISAPDCSYDAVISTQVLEHVRHSDRYLLEANRLLKPDGRLILSTHGSFYDHGCPWDFRRWTADGLKEDLERAGFRVEKVFKLTTNGRALAYLLRHFPWMLRRPRRHPIGLLSWGVSRFLECPANVALFDRWCDRVTAKERVVCADRPGHPLYIGLLAYACKESAAA